MKIKQVIFYFLFTGITLAFSAPAIAQTAPDTSKKYKKLIRKLHSSMVYSYPDIYTPKSDSSSRKYNREDCICIPEECNQIIIDGIKLPVKSDSNIVDKESEYFMKYNGNVPVQYDSWSSWLASEGHPFFVFNPLLGPPNPGIIDPSVYPTQYWQAIMHK